MRVFLAIIFCLLTCECHAQWPNPENARLTNTINGFMNAFGGGGFPAAVPMSDDEYRYDPSVFSNNNYQQQMYNSLTYAEIYFQKRQINMYYRTLEEVQKAEIKSLKKSKDLTVPEVNRLFNRNTVRY